MHGPDSRPERNSIGRTVALAFGMAALAVAVAMTFAVVSSSAAGASEHDEPDWQLPIPAGERWSVGAPHPDTGEIADCVGGEVVCDAIDIAPGPDAVGRVLAVAPGTVSWETCTTGRYLRIDHGGGWATTYYHLSDVREALVGTRVEAGEFLGLAGTTTPCGGFASGPHVHLTFSRHGDPVTVDGLSIGGHTVHSSGPSYEGFWTRDADGATVVTNDGLTAFGAESTTAFRARPVDVIDAAAVLDVGAGADVFVIATGTLATTSYRDDGGWIGAWAELGGPDPAGAKLVGAPAVVEAPDGSRHVVAVTDAGDLAAIWWTRSHGWDEWVDLGSPVGGIVSTSAALVAAPDGSVLTIVIGNDGAAHVRRRTATRWQPGWRSVGGSDLAGAPTALALPNGTIHVFAPTASGHVHRTHRVAGGGWRPWADLGTVESGFTRTRVAAERLDDGSIHVMANDESGRVHTISRSPMSQWQRSWIDLADVDAVGSPDTVGHGRSIEMVVIDRTGRVLTSGRDATGTWSAWQAAGAADIGLSGTEPSVFDTAAGVIRAGVTADGRFSWRTDGSASWTVVPGSPSRLGDGRTGEPVTSVGYWMVDMIGRLYAFGDAAAFPDTPAAPAEVTAIDVTDGSGVWVLLSDGRVVTRGTATHHGDLATAGVALGAGEAVASIAVLEDGSGYWIFTTAGRVSNFGSAQFLGDLAAIDLAAPVIASAATPSGRGYYLVGADGGIFTFGDAVFAGSVPETVPLDQLAADLVGIAPDPDGRGYWLVGADGGIFAFDAPFRGSVPGALPPGTALGAPATGAIAFADGYLVVAADGGIFNFSSAEFLGSLGADPPGVPIRAVAAFAN